MGKWSMTWRTGVGIEGSRVLQLLQWHAYLKLHAGMENKVKKGPRVLFAWEGKICKEEDEIGVSKYKVKRRKARAGNKCVAETVHMK